MGREQRPGHWLLLALAFLLLFWGISLERSYAYLGLQSQISSALVARNLHPLSVDFGLSFDAGLDWRRQLVAWQHQPASISNGKDGLAILPDGRPVELRFPFNGAKIDVNRVHMLELRFAAGGARPKNMALIVHADAQSPAWIAELPVDLSGTLDLNTLEFAREPDRVERRQWNALPNPGFVRLYFDLEAEKVVTLSRLAWLGAPKMSELPASLWPPELLNRFEAARVAGIAWPSVSYRGRWLSQPHVFRLLLLLAGIAWLSQFWLWLGSRAKAGADRTRAPRLIAAGMVLSFLPTIVGLYFDPRLGADMSLALLMAAPALSFTVMCFYLTRFPSRVAVGSWEGAYQALLITGSLGLVAFVGFAGFGPGLSPLMLEPKLAFSYLLFAALQQLLLQGVVLASLERLNLPRAWVVVLAASMFALWHLPNTVLMVLCFVAALLWCNHFLRYRSLMPLILSHAVLGWLLSIVIPQAWLRSAKIGVMYFW